MSARWFRLYDTVLDDPKVQRLSPVLFRTWINLLCVASRHDGALPPVPDLAFMLRMGDTAMAAQVKELIAAGLIDRLADGTLHPHKWSERQFKSDGSTERVKRFRQRSMERASAVSGTGPDTDTDTDTESEDKKIDNIINLPSTTPREALTEFPADGSIAYSRWADIVRAEKPGVDVDVVAQAFRDWARFKCQPPLDLGASTIEAKFRSFARRHKVRGVAL